MAGAARTISDLRQKRGLHLGALGGGKRDKPGNRYGGNGRRVSKNRLRRDNNFAARQRGDHAGAVRARTNPCDSVGRILRFNLAAQLKRGQQVTARRVQLQHNGVRASVLGLRQSLRET